MKAILILLVVIILELVVVMWGITKIVYLFEPTTHVSYYYGSN